MNYIIPPILYHQIDLLPSNNFMKYFRLSVFLFNPLLDNFPLLQDLRVWGTLWRSQHRGLCTQPCSRPAVQRCAVP